MKSIKKLGLIGKNISYSFSKKYFEDKFKKLMLEGYSYTTFDIPTIENIQGLLQSEEVLGLNVTIPYKETVIPFLDEVSEEAKKIGAVNTILIKNKKTVGYNTDAFGFEKCLSIFLKEQHQSALILGDGGASKAVQFVLDKLKIPFQIVARKSGIAFENLTQQEVQNNKLIVQCTPVGTFPEVENCVSFPFDGLTKEHLLIDLIYNPPLTQFLKKGQEKGAKTINGLLMLEQQAEAAWKIWTKS